MAGLKMTEVKKHLQVMEKEELVNEITQLIKLYPAVQEYYNLKLNPEAEKEILAKYKKTVENEFYPARGDGKMRHAVVKKAINDFKKVAKLPANIAELMLYYPKLGVEFTNQYGDIGKQFYEAIITGYDKALQYISENNLENLFRHEAGIIMQKTVGIGWGFNETMSEIYEEYYYEDEEI